MKIRKKAADAAFCGLFAALIAAGAFLRIPLPLVPLTLQTFFVLLAGLLLGARRGAAAVGLYVLVGLLGLPVFTGGGGLSYLLRPTFGYLLGMVAGAFLVGLLRPKKRSFLRTLPVCVVGILAVYAIGVPYLYLASHLFTKSPVGVKAVLFSGFLSPLPGDLLKAAAAALLAVRLSASLQLPE